MIKLITRVIKSEALAETQFEIILKKLSVAANRRSKRMFGEYSVDKGMQTMRQSLRVCH